MNNKGLTIIELMIVIVVMGIIASFSTIYVSEIISNTKKKALVSLGDTMIETARLSYYQSDSIWDDDKATLQELLDAEFITMSEYGPWNGTYDLEQSYVLAEYIDTNRKLDTFYLSTNYFNMAFDSSAVIFKVRIVTTVAILGKDAELEDYTTSDIYFIEVGSGSIIDTITVLFDNDLSEDTTLNDSDNFFTVQDNINNDAKVSTLDGADTVTIGGSVTNGAYLDTDGGNDVVKISQNVSGSATVETGSGDDTVDVYKRLITGGTVSTGAGADKVTIYVNFDNASLNTGAGDDVIIIGNMSSGANISSGDGNDKLTVHAVSNSFSNATITFGAGDDRVNIYDTMTGTSSIWDGGSGDDTLFLPEVTEADWTNGLSSKFVNFETIILLDTTLNP